MRKTIVIVLFLAIARWAGVSFAQQRTPAGEIEVLHVRGPIYMLAGAGSNITVSVGEDGVLLVDTGLPEMTDKVLATVRNLQKELVTSGVSEIKFGAETRSSLAAMLT